MLLSGMGFIGLYLAVGPNLPDVESIRKIRLQTPMRVYSADDKLIAEFGDTRRIPITLDQVPKDFINALLSTEDQRFYEHSGVDIQGLLRAFIKLLVTRTKSEGASTITMQVARNYYLSRAKQFSRKITEIFLAWKIESELSKNEILELYLNKIHFSHRAYGLGAAAQVYYGTNLDQLNLAQLATLAGIPKGESRYNPISSPENAKVRRSHVLGRMLSLGHITQAQFDQANAEPIDTEKHGTQVAADAPFLAEMVRQYAVDKYGLEVAYNDGLKFYTTLDSNFQSVARDSMVKGLEEYDRRHGYRGPEHHYELDEKTSMEQLVSWLSDIPVIGGLEPALVTKVEDSQAFIVLKDGSQASLPLEQVTWAKQYVDENHRELAPIKKVSDVVTIGDLIRVAKLKEDSTEASKAPESEKQPDNQVGDQKPVDLPQYRLAQIPDVSGGFVALDPKNGAIKALVGDYDFALSQFNNVTQARRQPGSNIKPFVYSAAFEKQYTPASLMNDMPIVQSDDTAENIWRPKNDGDNYLGPISLRDGLRRSRNTVSVRLIKAIGPKYTKEYLANIGFPDEYMDPYLSLALGSASFTPLEVVSAYAVLANGGYKVQPWYIDRVETSNGRILEQAQPITVCETCEEMLEAEQKASELAQTGSSSNITEDSSRSNEISDIELNSDLIVNLPVLPIPEEKVAPRVIDKRNHYLIYDILKDVIHRGTATRTLSQSDSPLLKRTDLAGKTGTTNDATDAWFSGFNRHHVATAWVGFKDSNKKLGDREYGGKAALPIWQHFMEQILAKVPPQDFKQPQGIETVRIDPKTGLLANELTENPVFEKFRSEDAPTEYAEKPTMDLFNQSDKEVSDDILF